MKKSINPISIVVYLTLALKLQGRSNACNEVQRRRNDRSSMKRFLALLIVLQPLICFSQILSPTKWEVSLSKQEVKAGETVDIIFTVTIDEGWYFYAVGEHPPHAEFSFEENPSYKLVGVMKESAGAKEKDDEVLEVHVRYFEKKAEFRQTIKVLKENPVIKIELEGQVCSNTSKQCIRVAKKFTVDNIKVISSAVKEKDSSKAAEKTVPVKKDDKNTSEVKTDSKESTSSEKVKKLEEEKAKLITKNAEGKDETVEYLKKFVKNYGKK